MLAMQIALTECIERYMLVATQVSHDIHRPLFLPLMHHQQVFYKPPHAILNNEPSLLSVEYFKTFLKQPHQILIGEKLFSLPC